MYCYSLFWCNTVRFHKDKTAFVPSQHPGFHTFAVWSRESLQTRTTTPDDRLSLMTDCVHAHTQTNGANALYKVAGISIVTDLLQRKKICFHTEENEIDDFLLRGITYTIRQ